MRDIYKEKQLKYKLRVTFYIGIGKANIVKMLIISKLICKFVAAPVK